MAHEVKQLPLKIQHGFTNDLKHVTLLFSQPVPDLMFTLEQAENFITRHPRIDRRSNRETQGSGGGVKEHWAVRPIAALVCGLMIASVWFHPRFWL